MKKDEALGTFSPRKFIITHINPHLDDIAAIWLYKKYYPGCKNAHIKFIGADEGKKGLVSTKSLIHIGVGMGQYDEHKGDLDDSSMSLVWKDIKSKKLLPKDELALKAVEEIVKWNTLIDTAKLPFWEFDNFNIENLIRCYDNTEKGSLESVEFGSQVLDKILKVLIRKQQGLKDFQKRVEFPTKWGKGVAVKSKEFSVSLAYRQGYMVVIQVDPENDFVGISAPATSEVDLTPVYDNLRKIDTGAGWFLHHSKKLLLCGSPSAPQVKKTKLSLGKIIEIAKSTS